MPKMAQIVLIVNIECLMMGRAGFEFMCCFVFFDDKLDTNICSEGILDFFLSFLNSSRNLPCFFGLES